MAITAAAKTLDRPVLLRRLGVPSDFPLVGDVVNVTPINLDVGSNRKLHEGDAHFLNFDTCVERCAGSRLVRFNRKTIAVPCFEQRFVTGEAVCLHCSEMWRFTDDHGFYKLSKSATPNAFAEYKPGDRRVLTNLAPVKAADDIYSQQISIIKQALDDTEFELSASWPDTSFKDFVDSVVFKAGVLKKPSTNIPRRLVAEQVSVGTYIHKMVQLWLRVRAMHDLTTLKNETHTLAQRGQSIQRAATIALQATAPKTDVESIHEGVYHQNDWLVFYDLGNSRDLVYDHMCVYYGI